MKKCNWEPKGTPSNQYWKTECEETIEVNHDLVRFGATNSMGYYKFCPSCGGRIQLENETK